MTTQEAYDTLQQRLATRYEEGEAKSISRIVLEDAFEQQLGQTSRPLSADEEMLFRHIQQRLLRGEPIQYILGEADFYGLKFIVDRRVLIPRQETEELVHWVLETWRAEEKGDLVKGRKGEEEKGRKGDLEVKVLDIGTGSGCIPITIKKEAPDLMVTGLDIEADILALAAENAQRNEVEISWIQADILDEQKWETFESYDYIISNPPYIPPSEQKLMPERVLKYEPHLALFAPENDPLLFYREIGLFAFQNLSAQGYLFFETNEFNAPQVAQLLRDIGFESVEIRKDLADKERMVRAQLPTK